ncbi:MAG: hypothetical protein FWE47_04090 [Oscillospiraceae bacterium]|nr:hypothetical protein [Oscillospiraceae bacterium]
MNTLIIFAVAFIFIVTANVVKSKKQKQKRDYYLANCERIEAIAVDMIDTGSSTNNKAGRKLFCIYEDDRTQERHRFISDSFSIKKGKISDFANAIPQIVEALSDNPYKGVDKEKYEEAFRETKRELGMDKIKVQWFPEKYSSAEQRFDFDRVLKGKLGIECKYEKVDVYVDENDWNKYYVDVEKWRNK